MTVNIAVIGAGAVGLSTALNVRKTIPNARVTILADLLGAETTSYSVGGSFRPDLTKISVNGEYGQTVRNLLRDSWNHYATLARSEHAGQCGIVLAPAIIGNRKNMDKELAVMRECCFDFHQLSEQEIQRMGIPSTFKYTYSCTTVIAQPSIYLDWLMKQFTSNGGRVQRRTVEKLEDLYGEYQLVINCCGLRAQTFLNDTECYPTKGQLVHLKAPWIKQMYYFDTEVQVFPHIDKVVVGGIRLDHDPNTDVRQEDTETMMRKAEELVPALKGAEIIGAWAGSRPSRSTTRLETELLDVGNNRTLPVIHNYGHAANGIALSWGTGMYASKLAEEALVHCSYRASL